MRFFLPKGCNLVALQTTKKCDILSVAMLKYESARMLHHIQQ